MPAVLQAVPEVKVLVLSMHDDSRYVRNAFDAGASGYVLKEAADTEVVAAVRAVAAGQQYINPTLGARLVAADAEARRRVEADRSPTASARRCGCSRAVAGARCSVQEQIQHLEHGASA